MYGINQFSCLILSLGYQFLTICLKSYILRKTCGFAQIAQKIAQNSLRFMRKNSTKVRKKNLLENSANFAQKI